jgi:hypothetical protein
METNPIDLSKPLLDRVSLTGVDDLTSVGELAALSERYPFVEWALLYVPHNEGAPRNPTKAWRQTFFEANLPGYSAVHLCGSLAFDQLLRGMLPRDVLQADRLQLNINARKREFTEAQVVDVYRKAVTLGPDIILQYHEDTVEPISEFLAGLDNMDRPRVHVLMDASKGTGVTPATWGTPAGMEGVFMGFAGGLGPHNMSTVLDQLEALKIRYWADMESGLRTENKFNISKAHGVLAAAARVLDTARRPD